MKKSPKKRSNFRIISVSYLASQFFIKLKYMKTIFKEVISLGTIRVIGGRMFGTFKVVI